MIAGVPQWSWDALTPCPLGAHRYDLTTVGPTPHSSCMGTKWSLGRKVLTLKPVLAEENKEEPCRKAVTEMEPGSSHGGMVRAGGEEVWSGKKKKQFLQYYSEQREVVPSSILGGLQDKALPAAV